MQTTKFTKADLKYYVTETGSHFFDRLSMRFSGDTMANYGLRDCGDCWELYRRKPVKGGLIKSAYFDKETYERIFKD